MKLSTTTPAGNGVLVRLDPPIGSMHQVCTISRKVGISAQRCFRFPCERRRLLDRKYRLHSFGRSVGVLIFRSWLIPFKKRRTSKRTNGAARARARGRGGEREGNGNGIGCGGGRNSGREDVCVTVRYAKSRAPLQTCAGNNKGIIYLFRFVPFHFLPSRAADRGRQAACLLAAFPPISNVNADLNVVSLCPLSDALRRADPPPPPSAPPTK